MVMTQTQRQAAAKKAHKSLAETRLAELYLDTLEIIRLAQELAPELPAMQVDFERVAKRVAIRKGWTAKDLLAMGVPETICTKLNLPS